MTVKTFKPLPLGNEDFVSIRQKGKYYVDKVSYLHSIYLFVLMKQSPHCQVAMV